MLLCEIGILRRVRPAVFAHIKTSAVYCFADSYRKKRLTCGRFNAKTGAETRIRCPTAASNDSIANSHFARQLLADLCGDQFFDFSATNHCQGTFQEKESRTSATGHRNRLRKSTLSKCLSAARSRQASEAVHANYSRICCLHGSPIVSCDISNAHWNFLPLILANRLDHVSREPGREKYVNDGWREHNRLIALLSDGDFYRTWCVDPQSDGERNQKKNLLTILLNKKNENCEQNILYRRIRAEFPITFAIIEDIKRNDHRNLSKQLHRFTADAIAGALLEAQREGIAAIPHVDALICQQKDREQVCEVIGRQIFEATGVCCAVGGIRYSPLTENEKQALAFDEIAPSDDGMDYDKWEAMRAIKTAAVLKLTSFIREHVGVTVFDPTW